MFLCDERYIENRQRYWTLFAMNYCELLVIGYWNDFREICEVMDDGRGGCERFEKLYVCVLLYVYNSFEVSLKGNRKGKCILLTRNSEICRECYCKLGIVVS